jgi:prophage antirepressor-like protein
MLDTRTARQAMAAPHTPTLFLHHNRPLRTLLLESQIWFCARDLGRLMSRPLSERTTRKLDEDQRRTVLLADHGDAVAELMVTESAVYALLAQHYHIDNRGLRRWISNEVVASIRDGELPVGCVQPSLSFLQWPGLSVSLLHWQSEPWIRLRDMPRMLPHDQVPAVSGLRRGRLSWWRAAWQVFRLG